MRPGSYFGRRVREPRKLGAYSANSVRKAPLSALRLNLKPGDESSTPALPSARKFDETRKSLYTRQARNTHRQRAHRARGLARAHRASGLARGASSRCGCHACTINSLEAHDRTAEALCGRCGVKRRDTRQTQALNINAAVHESIKLTYAVHRALAEHLSSCRLCSRAPPAPQGADSGTSQPP